MPSPTGQLFALFVGVAIVEALAFGVGGAFLVFGRPMLSQASSNPRGAKTVHVSIAWLLMNWWPHDNLHRANGMDMIGLVKIEWAFHVTLIIATFFVARFFWERCCQTVKTET